jgi:glycosyltransferase involved in cell wall biosynthesis
MVRASLIMNFLIMTFRNGLPWIEKAIESVLEQTFKDWELILVDDGSTDESKELVTKRCLAKPQNCLKNQDYFSRSGAIWTGSFLSIRKKWSI